MAGEVDWEAVRRAYEGREESVAAIRIRFGLKAWELRAARMRGGWTTRAPAAPPGAARGGRRPKQAKLRDRLIRAFAEALGQIEGRLAAGAELGPQDVRRLAALGAALPGIERLRAASAKPGAHDKATHEGDDGGMARTDIERLRAELKERLARLRETG